MHAAPSAEAGLPLFNGGIERTKAATEPEERYYCAAQKRHGTNAFIRKIWAEKPSLTVAGCSEIYENAAAQYQRNA
jgi:hypothetical protein